MLTAHSPLRRLLCLLAAFVAMLPAAPSLAARYGFVEDEAGRLWQVEIAADAAARSRGLMHRPWLAPWQGMLFLFPRPSDSAFWMKNTLIPLDIRFFDADGRPLARYPNAQPCLRSPCPSYPAYGPALYVLETRQHSWIGAKIRIIALPENLQLR